MDGFIALVGIAIALGTFVLVFVLPVATFLRVSRAVREAERANTRVDALARVVQDLLRERRLGTLDPGGQASPEAATAPAAAVGATTDLPRPSAAPTAPEHTETVVEHAGSQPAAASAVAPIPTVAEADASATRDEPAAGPATAAAPPPPPPSATAPTRVTPPPVIPPRPPAPHAHVSTHPSLEQRIGQRWLLYAGIAAIVLGASYLVKLAFENNWITPAMRVALSAAGGVLLVAGGLRFAAQGLRLFGYALAGGGFAVLYVSVYAAQHLYELVERGTAFAAMTVVTVVAAGLADRRSAQPIAMAALIGGFATPFLVGGDSGAYVALFSYLSLLIVGAAFLARRHAWPLLTLASFILTAFSFSAWAVTGYRDADYLVVQGFLTLWLVALLAAVAWSAIRDDDDEAAEVDRAANVDALTSGVAVVVGIMAPALYHLCSLANLIGHPRDLLIYFIVATLAGLLYSADGKRPWARLAIWVAVWLPMVGWLMERTPRGARVTVLAVFGLHLMSEVRVLLRDRERLEPIDVLLLHLNGLGLLAALLALHPRWDTLAMSTTVALVGVFYGLLALFLRPRHASAPLHYGALAAACAAGAIALRFEGAWVTVGWAVEGALVAWLGLRERRQWMRLGGWLLLGLALGHGLEQMAAPASVNTVPWVNAPALSLLLVAALLLWLASRYRALGQDLPGHSELPIGVAILGAAFTGLVVITEQINGTFGRFAWQQAVEAGPMAAGEADLARQVTLSIAWAAYAVALLVAGINRRYPLLRYLAILLLAVTIGKVFFVDLAQLDRVYRIVSVIGLGVLLLAASYLYQRFMTDEPGSGDAGEGPPPEIGSP